MKGSASMYVCLILIDEGGTPSMTCQVADVVDGASVNNGQ